MTDREAEQRSAEIERARAQAANEYAAKRYEQSQRPTLRDRFAMAALTAQLSTEVWLTAADKLRAEHPGSSLKDIHAQSAYQIADAMLKAREPKSES